MKSFVIRAQVEMTLSCLKYPPIPRALPFCMWRVDDGFQAPLCPLLLFFI